MNPCVEQADIEALERTAFRAWPAETVVDMDGWNVRWTQGMTRRGNSVAPLECTGEDDASLSDRVDRVELFYADHQLEPLFQLGACPKPASLDNHLAARGYEVEAGVTVQVATPRAVLTALTATSDAETQVEETVTDAWLEVAAKKSRFKEVPHILEGFLERIGGRARFPLALIDGEPACAAIMVCEPPWAGVYAMVTAPEFRRRGLGQEVMRAIGEWAPTESLSHLYLLVEDDNEAARALYGRAGFMPQYAYHYRRLRG